MSVIHNASIYIHTWWYVQAFSPLPVLPLLSSLLLACWQEHPPQRLIFYLFIFLIHGQTSVKVIRVSTLVTETIYIGILWTWTLHLFVLSRSPGVWWFHCLNTPSVIWCPRPTDKSQSRQFMETRNCQLCTARAFSWTDQRQWDKKKWQDHLMDIQAFIVYLSACLFSVLSMHNLE